MKTLFSFIIILFTLSAFSQQKNRCEIERLFSLNSNLSKEAVIDSVRNIYAIEPINASNKKTSEQKDILFYNLAGNECIGGKDLHIQFEFMNNHLVKAFAQTEYARTDYYDMLDNFNALRIMLKQTWEKERETKYASENLLSSGFDYSKPKQTKSVADKILLQYINTKPDKGYGIYLLQLSWINSSNTEIENIAY